MLNRINLGLEGDFWLDRSTWSTYMAFVLVAGLLLLLFLPGSQRIAELRSPSDSMVFFPTLFVILYGIVAMTLGQAEFDWQRRLAWPGPLLQLSARQSLALLLTLPYWLTFLSTYSLSPLMSLAVLLQLGIYGSVLGLFGWRLAQSQRSEIFRFNLKYLGFFSFLGASFFVPGLKLLNPFWPLLSLLEEGRLDHYHWNFLLWVAVGLSMVLWVRSCLNRQAIKEGQWT